MPAAPPILGSTGSTTFALVVALVALGVAILVAGFWLVRVTRTDKPALGPLEVMGDRRFSRRDADARTAALTSARPEGALGPAPMVGFDDDDQPDPDPDPDPEQPDEVGAEVVEPQVVEPDVAGPAEPAEATPQAH